MEVRIDEIMSDLRFDLLLSKDKLAASQRLVEGLGEPGVTALRRLYFPSWREGTVVQADPQLRCFHRVVVRDAAERAIVMAVAPPNVTVRVALQAEFGS